MRSVHGVISFTSNAAIANKTLEYAAYHYDDSAASGAILAHSIMGRYHSAVDIGTGAIHFDATLEQNDYIEFHVRNIIDSTNLTIKYIDELTSQMSTEQQNIQELTKNIVQLEAKMKHRQDDLRERLLRLYKWTPFYKLEIVFSSKSLPQILSSSYYLQILAKDDQQAFFEFKADWERYLVDKKMREDLITLLEDRRHEKESELDRLSEERQLKKQILDRVAKQESEKIKIEKELK